MIKILHLIELASLLDIDQREFYLAMVNNTTRLNSNEYKLATIVIDKDAKLNSVKMNTSLGFTSRNKIYVYRLLRFSIIYRKMDYEVNNLNNLYYEFYNSILLSVILSSKQMQKLSLRELKRVENEIGRSNMLTSEKELLDQKILEAGHSVYGASLINKEKIDYYDKKTNNYVYFKKVLIVFYTVKSQANEGLIKKVMNRLLDKSHVQGNLDSVEPAETRLHLIYIHYLLNARSGNVEKARDYLETFKSIVKSERVIIFSHFGGIYYSLANFEFYAGDFDMSLKYYGYAYDAFSPKSINQYKAYLGTLTALIVCKRYDIALEYYKRMSDFKDDSLVRGLVRMHLLFSLALADRDYILSFNQITSTSLATTTDKNLIASYKIYEIICLLAMGTFEPIHYRRDALRKFSYKMTSSYRPRVSWFLALLKEMDKTGYSRVLDKGSVAGSKIAELLKEGKKAKGVHNHYEYVRLEEWFVEEWFMRPSKKHLPLDDTGNHAKSRSN